MHLTEEQYEKINETLGQIAEKISDDSGVPILLMWGVRDEELIKCGATVSGNLTFDDAGKIALTCCGEVSLMYGKEDNDEEDDRPPYLVASGS